MRIISSYKQGQGMAHLIKILSALRSDDEIKRLDAVGNVADIAYIIGGVKMMMDVKDIAFGKEQEHE